MPALPGLALLAGLGRRLFGNRLCGLRRCMWLGLGDGSRLLCRNSFVGRLGMRFHLGSLCGGLRMGLCRGLRDGMLSQHAPVWLAEREASSLDARAQQPWPFPASAARGFSFTASCGLCGGCRLWRHHPFASGRFGRRRFRLVRSGFAGLGSEQRACRGLCGALRLPRLR